MALCQSIHPTHGPALGQCPHCNAYDLAIPLAPRGDDVVTCDLCSRSFTYAEVERHALASARKHLAERFALLGTA
jgi:hypothetical protein